MLSPQELKFAYTYWLSRTDRLTFERMTKPFLCEQFWDSKDWLKQARTVSLLSIREVARRMNISSGVYARMEKREAEGKITLEQMTRAAQALECEFIYGFRPRAGHTPSQSIFEYLKRAAMRHPCFIHQPAARKAQALAGIARLGYFSRRGYGRVNALRLRKQLGWLDPSSE